MPGKFKYIYQFNAKQVDGSAAMKDVLGGKGAGLAEMCRAGFPVPPGFTISTEACRLFIQDPGILDREVFPEAVEALKVLEGVSGKKFGSTDNPLLVSVRSGAKFSMPGMMDTVLNIGLNDETVKVLERDSGNPDFAYDCYRRLLEMFGDVVLGIPRRNFERSELRDGLPQLCGQFKKIILAQGKEFPQEPLQQLRLAVESVFKSWNTPRAVTYRRLNNIPNDLGTAVNVQTMVFGNLGKDSGTGVGFTRNPATGERQFYGEFLPQAQGEEVVAGRRTPLHLDELQKWLPQVYAELLQVTTALEKHYREMQDFEFTIERGKLYMLQTRAGKRTGKAAVRIALDMHRESLISVEEALMRVQPEQLEQLLHSVFKEIPSERVLAQGLPASPGAAVGRIVFTAEEAVRRGSAGEPVILVRGETTPDDIHGMQAADGIVTARGGMTSHAAVVARGMGKCCVVGCEALQIDSEKQEIHVKGTVLYEGDFLSVDGIGGRVILGKLEKVSPEVETGLFNDYISLVEGIPSLLVRANADTVRDATMARHFGAKGIGLCRTEHMFFAEERIPVMQEAIMAHNEQERNRCLEVLKKFQKEDFKGILEVMDGLPVTVRLLDPPLHEFLPRKEELQAQIRAMEEQGAPRGEILKKEKILNRSEELKDVNPMLGHRGCRLGITSPEITRMQATALCEAACELKKEGKSPVLEVMVPLVSLVEEFRDQEQLIRAAAEEVFRSFNVRVDYLVGTMIELPRAALIAGDLARYSEFFSFGTNDLTQTTFGFSRDDSGKFIKAYREKNILASDPFQTLDREGVGELVRMAAERGRGARPGLKLGVCGEHGGDPASIYFCHELKLDYVSCSPYRVPAARLAAAQAALMAGQALEADRVGA